MVYINTNVSPSVEMQIYGIVDNYYKTLEREEKILYVLIENSQYPGT